MEEENKYYKRNANSYSEFKNKTFNITIEQYSFRNKIKELLDSNNLKPDFSAVDLACGSGTYTRILREYTEGEVIGVDISQEMVNISNKAEEEAKLNITYVQGDCLSDLNQILLKKFDLVNACWLFNYATDEDKLKEAVKNAKNILKEGGILMGIINNSEANPDTWVISQKFGCSSFPKDKNAKKLKNGEPMIFVMFEPGKYQEPYTFQVENYFYYEECYKKAFEEAGFTVTMYPFEIDPDYNSLDYETLKDYGLLFIAKLN